MSTISGLGGTSQTWSTSQSGQSRKAEHDARMFAKVDTDGSGSVDATELAAMLAQSGQTSQSTSSADLLKKMDSNGDGTLSSDELSQGMRSLMPPPSSTLDFAQARGAANDANGGADPFASLDTNGDGQLSRAEFEAGRTQHGPQGAGGPPPAQASSTGSTGTSSATSTAATSATSSSSFDPLDVNQDGTVSQIERLAGALKELAKSGTGDATKASANSEIASLAQKLYDQISKNWLQPAASAQVSTSA